MWCPTIRIMYADFFIPVMKFYLVVFYFVFIAFSLESPSEMINTVKFAPSTKNNAFASIFAVAETFLRYCTTFWFFLISE